MDKFKIIGIGFVILGILLEMIWKISKSKKKDQVEQKKKND